MNGSKVYIVFDVFFVWEVEVVYFKCFGRVVMWFGVV